MGEAGPAREGTAFGMRPAENPFNNPRNDVPVASTGQDQVHSSCSLWCQSHAN